MVGWELGGGGDLLVYNRAVYCPDPALGNLVEFLLPVSVRSWFILLYIRGIPLLAKCFNTLHPDLIFLICCNCCLHLISLVQFSSTVLVPPYFYHIFVPF